MSTRCQIGLAINDSGNNLSVVAIYCHYDGYPYSVGKTLATYYNTVEKIKKLLLLGDLSSLGEIPISDTSDWYSRASLSDSSNRCKTYADRGEKTPAKYYSTLEQYYNDNKNIVDFLYLFYKNTWYYLNVESKSWHNVKTKKGITNELDKAI